MVNAPHCLASDPSSNLFYVFSLAHDPKLQTLQYPLHSFVTVTVSHF